MYLSAANKFVVVFLVFDLRHRDHVSPNLMQIHWLPVRSRVQFKLCIMVHAIHNKRSPSPISRRCTDCGNSNYFFFCNLLVATFTTTDYVVPWTHSKMGELAFPYAGPAAWNRLPEHIRRMSTPAIFRRHFTRTNQ